MAAPAPSLSEVSSYHDFQDDTTTDASFRTPLAAPEDDEVTPRGSFDLNRHEQEQNGGATQTPLPERTGAPESDSDSARLKETQGIEEGQKSVKKDLKDSFVSSNITQSQARPKTPTTTEMETTSSSTTEPEKEPSESRESIQEKRLTNQTPSQDAPIIPPGIIAPDPVGAATHHSEKSPPSQPTSPRPFQDLATHPHSTDDNSPEDESKYPSGTALSILTLGLFLATFVVALDNTIIATAIPRITGDFDSLGDVGWYGSSYLLTTTSLQPSFGKIYTYFDVKWTYLFALFIFEVGSVICATAPNSVALIVGRAVAGVGASALFSGGMTIVGYSVPLRKRAFYIALLSSTFGIASVVGPLLGGVFTDSRRLTWRFCFWINLPFGGLAILTTLVFFKSPERKHSQLTLREKIGKMDLLGAFLLICGIVCLLLALQWGGTFYPWRDSRVWGCLLGFGLIIACFIAVQIRLGEEATIPPRILSQRTVRAGCLYTSLLSMGLYAHIYYLPFYFQAIKSTSAEGSGIRTIPYLVSITLASILAGGCITKFGLYAPFMWFGAALFTVGGGMLYTLHENDGAGKWVGWQLLAGLGAGCGVQVPFIATQVVLSARDMPTGNALTIFFNSLGGALSISIAQNIFSNTLVEGLSKSLPLELVYAVVSAGATGVRDVVPERLLGVVLRAYDEAVTRAFILPIAVGGLALLAGLTVENRSVKGKSLVAGTAA